MALTGTSTNTRGSPALRPGWLAIDSRTPRQLLAGTPRTASLFRFYDDRNRPRGHWDAFFENQPLVQYASLAEIDVVAQEGLFHTELQGIGQELNPAKMGDQAAAWSIIDRLLWLYARIDRAAGLFGALPSEAEYAGMLHQAIVGPLRTDRRKVLECRAWLIEHPRYPFEEPGWPGAVPNRAFDVFTSGWETPAGVIDAAALDRKSFVRQLSAATWSTHATTVQLVHAAADWFERRYAAPTNLQPHFALYLAFLRQFGRAQAALNRIPQRHCEFFYREVLKMHPAPAVPDTTYVSFTAAPNAWISLPAGTPLTAGKDPNGLPITYATTAETIVTAAQVSRFSTVFLASPSGNATGFYVAPQANSTDGQGAPLPPGASWATFGEEQAGRIATARTMADAEVGFAISSAVLHLESGLRTIELVVAYRRPSETLQSPSNPLPPLPVVPGIIEYSSAQAWVTVPAEQTACALHYASEASGTIVPLNVTFTITLEAGDPACVNYDPKALGPGYDARVPALRVRYANPLTAFPTSDPAVRAAFLNTAITAAVVRVSVNGLVPTVMFGPGGTLAASKPMPIFGSPVQPSAEFLLGSVELFRKQPQALTASVDWVGLPTDPNGLSDYFGDYLVAFSTPPPAAFRNDQYLVQWSALFDCAWMRIDTPTVPPPAGELDGEYVFSWSPPPGSTVPSPVGQLASSSTWNADTAALRRWEADPMFAGPLVPGPQAATGFLQLRLAAPEYLFGQPLYATVVSKIALDNALAITSAAKPPPKPPPPSSYTLAAAYKILVTPAPPATFLQRVGKMLHISDGKTATFKPAVLPAVTAAGMFSPEVKAFVLAADAMPDETYAALVAMVTKPPPFSDPASLADAVAKSLGLHAKKPAGEAARDEIIGWMASLLYKPTPPAPPTLKPLPRPPLVPTATNVRLSYTAEAKIDLAANAANPPAWNRMWQLAPFAVSEMPAQAALLPHIAEGGTLFLGITGASPPETLALLFILEDVPISQLPATSSDQPTWSYLVGDAWQPAQSAIHRGTDGFLRTGIVRIDLPDNLDLNHTTMPAGFIWVRAEVTTPAAHLRTVQVLPNAAVARWVPPAGMTRELVTAHFASPLAPKSITGLQTPNPSIAAVVQPLPAAHGVPPETNEQFITRVSERLRHKGRAVAARDYERILLQTFPSVFYARAVRMPVGGSDPLVCVMVLPKVATVPSKPPPGFVPGDLATMQQALRRVAPLGAQVAVTNPAYAPVQVTVTVKFRSDRSHDYYKQQLTSDLAAFISPWIYDQAHVTEPVRSFHVSDFSTFIRARPYVLDVGTCTVAVQSRGGAASSIPSDIIEPRGPLEVLIAAAVQNITAV